MAKKTCSFSTHLLLWLVMVSLLCSFTGCNFKAATDPNDFPQTLIPDTGDPSGSQVPSITEPLPETTEQTPDTEIIPPDTEPVPPDTTDTQPATPDTPPEASVESATVSFLAAGDNLIYKGTWVDAARGQSSGSYDFAKMYRYVTDAINAADFAYINQETLMCGPGYELTAYPHFNSPRQVGTDLLKVGFDIIGIANNHMADKGSAGLSATIDFLKQETAAYGGTLIGGYEDRSDYETIRTVEKDGVVIALLAYTYGTGASLGASTPVLPILEKETVKRHITAAKEIADVVIVFPHWGKENTFSPNAYQTEWAQFMADCGADVIIGTHPHVIQPITILTGKDGNQTLCAYSIGNFLHEQAKDYNLLGGMLTFDIVKTGDEISLENILFTPTICHYNKSWQNVIYPLANYTNELCAEHAVDTFYGNGPVTLEKLISYLTSTIDSAYLPDTYH